MPVTVVATMVCDEVRVEHNGKLLAFPISEFGVCSCGFLVHPL
jgi:hypothetical protein